MLFFVMHGEQEITWDFSRVYIYYYTPARCFESIFFVMYLLFFLAQSNQIIKCVFLMQEGKISSVEKVRDNIQNTFLLFFDMKSKLNFDTEHKKMHSNLQLWTLPFLLLSTPCHRCTLSNHTRSSEQVKYIETC